MTHRDILAKNRDLDASIAKFRDQQLYFGTSSWKYEGWKDLIYRRDYKTDKAFQAECLSEYAEHYSAVGVDHTYYTWPTAKTFETYCQQTPEGFLFLPKATERVTVFRYPNIKRYGKEAGLLNPDFLNAEAFIENFIRPLAPFRNRLGPVMFEFSQFYPGMLQNGSEFVERLGHFLAEVTSVGEMEFAVEMRNRNWLEKPYFSVLEELAVGHVFNSWTRMPSLAEQLEKAEGFDLPFYLSRILLQPGVKYEQAVEAYSPYNRIQNEQPQLRKDAATIVDKARTEKKRAFTLVNNRAEGCAPLTISAIIEILEKASTEG